MQRPAWALALALAVASASERSTADTTPQAPEGTWTGAIRNGAEATLKITTITARGAQGVVCESAREGRVRGRAFTDREATRGRARARWRGERLQIEVGPYTYEYAGVTRAGPIVETRRTTVAGREARRIAVLSASKHPTCAQAFSQGEEPAPKQPQGSHPMVGNWNAEHAEVRIERIANDGSVQGAICTNEPDTFIEARRLEHTGARASEDRMSVAWREVPTRGDVRSTVRHTLRVTTHGVEYLREPGAGEPQSTPMVQGVAAGGCLSKLAPRWRTRAENANVDTWTHRTRHGTRTLRTRADTASTTVQGIACSRGADGTTRGLTFTTGESRHGVRAVGGPERLTVWAGRTIRTYQADPHDPNVMKVSLRTARTKETDKGTKGTLRERERRLRWTDARTCADLFTMDEAHDAHESQGDAPIGAWSARWPNGAISEVRVESIDEDGAVKGLFCTAADPAHIRAWRLEDPQIAAKARRPPASTSIIWRRRASKGGLEKSRTYVITAHAMRRGESIMQMVLNNGAGKPQGLEMWRGADPNGCLARLAKGSG